MTLPLRSALLVAVLSLSACDTTDPFVSDSDLDDAASVVARALAVNGGGALEEAASAAALVGSAGAAARSADPTRRGCTYVRSYDDDASLWTVDIACERGDDSDLYQSTFERVSTYQFLDADDAPQRDIRGAATIRYGVESGSSLYRFPRGVHSLRSLASTFTVDRLDDALVRVNGAYERAATDTLRGPRGERTVDYTLSLEFDDVLGPPARRWRTAVDGSIEGRLRSTITRTPAGGETETVEVDRTFTIAFDENEAGERDVLISFEGTRFRADVDTGDLLDL